jgi:hypothetical protein
MTTQIALLINSTVIRLRETGRHSTVSGHGSSGSVGAGAGALGSVTLKA